MDTFENTSERELAEIVRNRDSVTLEISNDVLGFEDHIPEVDFSKPREVPPTSVIHSPELAAQIMINTGNDQKGKYIRLIASVYWGSGKILYRKTTADKYELSIHWG